MKRELQTGLDQADNPDYGSDADGPQLGELRALVTQQAEQLESLDAERNSLLSISSSLQEEVQHLRHALSEAAAAGGDVEDIVIEAVEREAPANELESVTRERDELKAMLQAREQGEAEFRGTVEALRAKLEQEQQRLSVLQAEGSSRDAQLETYRVESSQKDVNLDILREELEAARQQISDLQKLVEQGDERVRSLEEEYQDSARKSHDDLKRKNDIEKEMQGQIDRLRKQLEQTTRDYQKSRSGSQEDLDNLRDELHAERQARAEERAQMAARQRELKEQLAAVATEHEVNFTKQSGVIEEAVDAVRTEERGRLQAVLEAHAASEEQLARVQQELQQAHAEMVVLRHQERERNQADMKLMEEQYRQAETTIKQLQAQLHELTRERDSALEEQNTLHEKLSALRGEVEVARGLMNVPGQGQAEDPVRLRKQLDEARRNVEMAVRLRAEAEVARDRLLNEKNALLAQLDGGSGELVSLHIPLLDEGDVPDASRSEAGGATAGPRERITLIQPSTVTGADSGKRRFGWLVGLVGLLVAGAIAAAGWWLVVQDRPVPVTQEDAVQADPGSGNQPENGGLQATRSGSLPLSVTPPPIVAGPAQRADPGVPAAQVTAEEGRAGGKARDVPTAAQLPGENPAKMKADAPQSTRSARQAVLRTYRDNLKIGGEGPVMVELGVAGYFMGSYSNSLNYEEGPRHLVKLPGFSIGKYEVTFAEYDRFARATGRRLPHDKGWGRGERPVVNVSWSDAQSYVEWLSAQTGHTYRLPSEAEWEYAVRGGSNWVYWWMDSEDAEVTDGVWANCHNCGSEWDGARTAPVGQFPANSYGLYDMAGNVQEWVMDCYHGNYEGAPQDGSAWVSPFCTQRVVRGGGYTSPLDTLRSAKRGQLNQDTRLDNLGFRVVREN